MAVFLVLALGLLAPAQAANQPLGATTADAIQLRDGQVVLGQVVERRPDGSVTFLVRRAWAEAKLPYWARLWREKEAPVLERVARERRLRLDDWERDRKKSGARIGADPVLALIQALRNQLASLARSSVLMSVSLTAEDVPSITRQSPDVGRWLRVGWLAALPDVETMGLEEVLEAISPAARAVAVTGPVSVRSLLPPGLETEDQWRLERAATEVWFDETVRFVRFHTIAGRPDGPRGRPLSKYQELVFPEGLVPVGFPPPATLLDIPAARETFGSMLEFHPNDRPIGNRLEDVALAGGVGAIVTDVSMAGDFLSARATRSLWVRDSAGRWAPALTRDVARGLGAPALSHGVTSRPGDPDFTIVLATMASISGAPPMPSTTVPNFLAAQLAQTAFEQARLELEAELRPLLLGPPIRP